MKYHVQEDSFVAPLPTKTAEERLLGAVLLRAWRDLLDPARQDDAWAWFADRTPAAETDHISYAYVCEALDLDMERLWIKIQQMINCEYVDTHFRESSTARRASLD